MAIDYDFRIIVGFRFSSEDMMKPFTKVSGQDRFEMQDRFDEKTGKKKSPVKVQVEEQKTVVSFGDFVKDDEMEEDEFLRAVATMNRFQIEEFGCLNHGNSTEYVVFPMSHPDGINPSDLSRNVHVYGHLSWEEVKNMGQSLEELKEKLQKIGLNPGEPEIVSAASAC